MSPNSSLQELARRQPETILALDELAREWASFHLTNHAGRRLETDSTQLVSLALIGTALDNLQKPDAVTLLGGLIRLSPVVLATARENQPLGFNDYLPPGMRRLTGPDGMVSVKLAQRIRVPSPSGRGQG